MICLQVVNLSSSNFDPKHVLLFGILLCNWREHSDIGDLGGHISHYDVQNKDETSLACEIEN